MSGGRWQVEVEREGDALVLTWPAGEAVAVEVHASPDPADGTEAHRRHGPDRGGRLVLDGLDPARRWYLHVRRGEEATAVVAAERRVPMDRTLNFRDLGGYPAAGGRTVRWGRVFRSDHLGALTPADVDRIAGLGVRTVVDYQGAHEHGDDPRPDLPATIRRLARPIVDGPAPGVTFYRQVTSGELSRFEAADLAAFYLRTLEGSARVFGEVLGLIADPAHHAVVFHCRAGKDRTGLTAALLLGALGVDDGTILDDYVLTNRFRSGRRVEVLRPELAARGIDIEDYLPLFVAPREAMADALAALVKRYGSVGDYLCGAAGLGRSALADLRRHLLT